MNKMFVVADDLTGALDTGVCFASMGIGTCVRLSGGSENWRLPDGYSVAVAVTESRHMSPKNAYRAVFRAVEKAACEGFPYIYKKTDSALRGNIGAELTATLDAAKGKTLHFIPAFPKMNRVTRNGLLYIDGNTPVAQSVFAVDPFNPVRHSSVLEIIAEQTDTRAYAAGDAPRPYPAGIAVHDAADDGEILSIGSRLVNEERATLFSGCAGFADALPQLIAFERIGRQDAPPSGKIAVFCGSVNPISLGQCDLAERDGYPRFHLQREGRFQDADALKKEMISAAHDREIVMLDTGADLFPSAGEEALEQGAVVADKFSAVISGFLLSDTGATLCVIGGDTLLAFARNLGIEEFIPIRELLPGVVLCRFAHGGKRHFLITKSGGFGSASLLLEIYRELNRRTEPGTAGEGGAREA